MANEETKAWLRSYRYLQKEAERVEDELAFWRSKAEKMTRQMSGMPGSSGEGDRVSAAVEKIVELEEKLEKAHAEVLERREAIESAIDTLPNETYRLLLKLKYINNDTWEVIAEKMNKSSRHTRRIHNFALKELEMSLNVLLDT